MRLLFAGYSKVEKNIRHTNLLAVFYFHLTQILEIFRLEVPISKFFQTSKYAVDLVLAGLF